LKPALLRSLRRGEPMLLPSRYTWFEPVLFAALIVFGINVIGSILVFSRRPVLNALASALLFALIFGLLVFYGYGRVEMAVSTTPTPSAPANTQPQAKAPGSETLPPEAKSQH
jgi:hypothetical protein